MSNLLISPEALRIFGKEVMFYSALEFVTLVLRIGLGSSIERNEYGKLLWRDGTGEQCYPYGKNPIYSSEMIFSGISEVLFTLSSYSFRSSGVDVKVHPKDGSEPYLSSQMFIKYVKPFEF